jgi:hypothetical protein
METLFGELSPVLVLAMIVGLVEFAKKLHIEGQASLALSMGLGILFGVLFQVAELYPAVAPWFRIAVFGILFGLSASGLYDLGKRFAGH